MHFSSAWWQTGQTNRLSNNPPRLKQVGKRTGKTPLLQESQVLWGFGSLAALQFHSNARQFQGCLTRPAIMALCHISVSSWLSSKVVMACYLPFPVGLSLIQQPCSNPLRIHIGSQAELSHSKTCLHHLLLNLECLDVYHWTIGT